MHPLISRVDERSTPQPSAGVTPAVQSGGLVQQSVGGNEASVRSGSGGTGRAAVLAAPQEASVAQVAEEGPGKKVGRSPKRSLYERRMEIRKKIETFRKQLSLKAQKQALKATATATTVTPAEGVVDVPLVGRPTRASGVQRRRASKGPRAQTTVVQPSEATLLADALTFPSGNVTIEQFDDKELLVRRRSLQDPWDVGLRFDWTAKTLAIGSFPTYDSMDTRCLHPFVKKYQSRPVWFLEEVNGTKANNIREVTKILKKSLSARFVFKN
ncbi:hypothetical protein ERJ75_001039600 [Trypanosoma vivax]|nr:hypothetical protein ERJ75_001039600 [Trypanosoma vivax]